MPQHAFSANQEFNINYKRSVIGLRNTNRQLFPASVTAKPRIFIMNKVWSMEISTTVNTGI
jgi:hypothetical protein